MMKQKVEEKMRPSVKCECGARFEFTCVLGRLFTVLFNCPKCSAQSRFDYLDDVQTLEWMERHQSSHVAVLKWKHGSALVGVYEGK